jgi:hypothetical protein
MTTKAQWKAAAINLLFHETQEARALVSRLMASDEAELSEPMRQALAELESGRWTSEQDLKACHRTLEGLVSRGLAAKGYATHSWASPRYKRIP